MKTLRVERPYDSVEAYVEGDFWTVDRSDMLLVGGEPTEVGTPVEFIVALRDGTAVVRGEGKVTGAVEATGGRPSGVRVRFRQLDAPSKSVLRRALEAQKRAPATSKAEPAASAGAAAPDPAPQTPDPAPSPSAEKTSAPSEPSGIRHRISGPIAPPENREALLERLRERALAKTRGADPKRSSAAE